VDGVFDARDVVHGGLMVPRVVRALIGMGGKVSTERVGVQPEMEALNQPRLGGWGAGRILALPTRAGRRSIGGSPRPPPGIGAFMSQRRCAILIGASSGIGEALAKKLLRKGWNVGLVARRAEELERIAAPFNRRERRAFTYPHDVTRLEEAAPLFQQIVHEMGGFDMAIYCAGVMPKVAVNEYNIEKDKLVFDVNVLGAIAWLNEAAARCEQQQSGTIVGIGSVAGDRGRKGQPVYCASKAAFHTYLEGLRNRLGHRGVTVVTIKPGPVRTPMTEGLKMPFMISADQAADGILRAIDRRAVSAYVPIIWWPIMTVIRLIPSFLFRGKDI
jgi:NAD(P)-dependent dehydrogenase (short-subunit alcohol dehydrogenase family)